MNWGSGGFPGHLGLGRLSDLPGSKPDSHGVLFSLAWLEIEGLHGFRLVL